MITYRIIRMYRDHDQPSRTIARGLSLDEAQAHCRDPETSSSTATTAAGRARTARHGPWFDGYEAEPQPRATAATRHRIGRALKHWAPGGMFDPASLK